MTHIVVHIKKNQEYKIFIERAAEIINEGLLLGIRTECLYFITVNPMNSDAINAIFNIRNQDRSKGLILIASEIDEIESIIEFDELSLKIAKRIWPAPISIMLPLKKELLENPNNNWNIICGDNNKVEVLISNDSLIIELLKKLKEMSGIGYVVGGPASFENDENLPINGIKVVQNFAFALNFIIEAGTTKYKNFPTKIEIKTPVNEKDVPLENIVQILYEGPISADEIFKRLK